MRLVCPNCVAQYEVADGTIPETGRDVQCANCNHIWFQDAAFKLSTDDLIYVPQKLHATYHDDEDDDDAPGVFHSKRAANRSSEATGRTLPEVGNNILDILRSEAAFSSHRRAASPVDRPEPEPPTDTPGTEAATEFGSHRFGTRAGDIPPPQASEGAPPQWARRATEGSMAFSQRSFGTRAGDIPPEPADAEPETAHQATGDTAEEPSSAPPDTGFKNLNWHHLGSSQPDGGGEQAGPDSAAFQHTGPEPEQPESEQDDTGLAADEAKRTPAVALGEPAVQQDEPAPADTEQDAEQAEEPDKEFRQTIRRISVRNLAEAAAAEEESASHDLTRQMQEAADLPAETSADEDLDDAIAAEEQTAADLADDLLPEEEDAEPAELAAEAEVAETEEEDLEAPRAGPDTEPEVAEEETAEADLAAEDSDTGTADEAENAEVAQEAKKPAPSFIPIDNPEDIRHLRRSLVENRKVLLPDVDELNTSLRMEKAEKPVDLRSSAFSEEDIANRSRFWLGLVTALMLFGILSALYLMGPAISDTFPAADPYVVAYRGMVDSAIDATAAAWVLVVNWLESL